MKVTLLGVSLWRAFGALIDEVRRSPTWIVVIMLAVVIAGTLLAIFARST